MGADGIHAMGWLGPRGPLGIALKVMDGDIGRARTAIVLAVLRALGAFEAASPLPEAVTAALTVRNHRQMEVGEVRPVFTLSSAAHRAQAP
jgi:L-asparaginase II